MTDGIDLDELARHTEEYAEDRDLRRAQAAMEIAEQAGVETREILTRIPTDEDE